MPHEPYRSDVVHEI